MPKHLRKRTKDLARCRDEHKQAPPDLAERNKRYKKPEAPEDAEPLLKQAYKRNPRRIAKSWKLKTDKSKCHKAAWLSERRDYDSDQCLLMPGFVEHRASRVRFNYKSMPAAKAMLLMTQGLPKVEGAVVAHKCGNGHLSCCNPKHLYWGTASDNARDRVLHDPKTKPGDPVSKEIADQIKADGRLKKVIAWEYGIPVSQVDEIRGED